ncbi:hypothetical protein PENTCL1PPCAC_26197, partial [Pristionchus entomophagus]
TLHCPFTDGLVLPSHNNNNNNAPPKHDDSPPPLGTASVIKTTPIEPADVPSTENNQSGEVKSLAILPTLEVRAARQKRLLSVAMKRSDRTSGAQLLGRTCPICRRVFENRCKLTLHQMEHKREANPYKCPLRGCPAEYPDYRQLRVHLITSHNGVMGAPTVQRSVPIPVLPTERIVKEEVMDD